ncbi:MAG: GNAT family N-acetyltransferase [Gammaproteobacteria bacterium]|nr:MAG: GNAT family N-acetyltransferase [Gammaproteobacteria bacterium]
MKIAESDQEILACFNVLKELRPRIEEESFLATIRLMQTEGYVISYIGVGGEVVSVSGFRICMNLAAEGKALYVYDLVTSESQRSKGHGASLIKNIITYANEKNCNCVHLDSNVVRHKAHKFYLENGFDIVAHHFLLKLK